MRATLRSGSRATTETASASEYWEQEGATAEATEPSRPTRNYGIGRTSAPW
jgi:hypothetical protein